MGRTMMLSPGCARRNVADASGHLSASFNLRALRHEAIPTIHLHRNLEAALLKTIERL